MKRRTLILPFLCISFSGFSQALAVQQTTAIPDANFEQALIDLGIDSNGLSGDIVNTDAEAVTGALDVGSKSIADLTGIEAFTELTKLYCTSNQLTSVDISQNSKLTEFNCQSNQIVSLDVSNNTLLTILRVNSNQLTSLDVTNNPDLKTLILDNNQLTTIDITQNTGLETFSIQSNQFTNLDISQNAQLRTIQCAINQITSLDVSNNTDLVNLYCRGNLLTTIDVSQNTNLLRITINDNQLTSLDVSQNIMLSGLRCFDNLIANLDLSLNPALEVLFAHDNQLVTLDVKNGTNTNITDFDATGNPSLQCIQVDDASYSTANWTDIDAGASFNEDCRVYVPDDNFEQALIDLGYDTGALDDHVPTLNISSITALDVSNKNIADLTGIEGFMALDVLLCQNNQLASLDVTQNTALTQLNGSGNLLTSLNVKNGNNSNFTSFDATNNPNLICIQVDDAIWSAANWTSIDASSFSADCSLFGVNTSVPDDNFEQALIDLGYDDVLDNNVATANINSITSLVVTNENIADLTGIEDFISLTTLICFGNELSNLDVSSNTLLTTLFCNSNQLTNLDITNNTALADLKCANNNLSSLDVSQNPLLHTLGVDGNQLTSLDVSNNTALTSLSCQKNALTTLDISVNSLINVLYCFDNQLTQLNVKNGNNTNFLFFNATNNPNLFCVQVDDASYSTTNWTDIDAGASFSEDCQYDDDGDGVTNDQEASDGTNPQDGCNYLVANQIIGNVSGAWNLSDCDCDGITNGDEIVAGSTPLPVPPTGSSDQSFCADANPTIADLVVSGSLIQWYSTPAGGAPLDASTLLVDGTSYHASQTVGICDESGRFEVTATILSTSKPTGMLTQNFCIDDNPTVVDLSAAGTNIQWYLIATGGVPLTSNISLVNGNYHASQTISGCQSERLEVSVSIDGPSVPTGSPIQSFCLENNPTVADLVAAGTNIQWYDQAEDTDPLPGTAPLTDREFAFIYASETIGSCESDRLEVLVDIITVAHTPTGPSFQNFCTSDTPTIADLTVTGTNITWYDAFEGGAVLDSNTPLADNTSYYASQTTNVCGESIRFEAIVTIDDPTTPEGPTTQMFCLSDSPVVADLAAEGTNIKWYEVASGGSALDPAAILESGDYFASETVGGCESSRLGIVVSVDDCTVLGVEHNTSSNMMLYPTVTTSGLTMELDKIYSHVTILTMDVQGRKKEMTTYSSTSKITFDLAGPRGIYLITVQTSAGESSIFKVIKN